MNWLQRKMSHPLTNACTNTKTHTHTQNIWGYNSGDFPSTLILFLELLGVPGPKTRSCIDYDIKG